LALSQISPNSQLDVEPTQTHAPAVHAPPFVQSGLLSHWHVPLLQLKLAGHSHPFAVLLSQLVYVGVQAYLHPVPVHDAVE
jgi:hypothetical protein